MIRIRTVLAAVIIPVSVVLALAAPAAAGSSLSHHRLAPAAARHIAEGKQQQAVIICTKHGHPHPHCGSVVDPFRLGDEMRNGFASTALPLFWHNISETAYGMSIGYWELSTGQHPRVIGAAGTAAHPDCHHLVIKKSSDEFGTTTGWLFGADGSSFFFSRACQPKGGPWATLPPKIAWYTNQSLADPWHADGDRTNPPIGTLFRFVEAPAEAHAQPAQAHTTAFQCQWIIGHSKWGGSWFEGRFAKNTCEETLRGFVHCQEGRDLEVRTGGWVEPANKWSKATCLPGWSLKGGGVDVKCETCSSYHRYWVTGDFAFDVPAAHYIGGAQPSTVALVHRACKLAYTITQNTSDIFEIKFTQTCGQSYRAWRRWGGSDYDLGTYRKCPGCSSNYSVACDVTSCQSHPDGAPFCYGYQDKSTGVRTTLGGCSSRQRHHLALAA